MKKLLLAIAGAGAMTAIMSGAPGVNNDKNAIGRSLSVFNSVFKELNTAYVDTIDPERLTRDAVDYMLSTIDPYTEYYPAEELEDLTQISSGRYGGIGAYISARDGKVYISRPVPGTPAREAGLRHGDVILAVDGTPVTPGTGTDKVSRMLRGTAGTKVSVTVDRPWDDDSLPLTFDLVRREIVVNPLPYYGIDSHGMGYISLNTFNEASARAVKDAVQTMMATDSLQGLVLDLRNNGGGLLESAVQIAGLFVPRGTEIVRTRGTQSSSDKIYRTTSRPIAPELPLVILVNEGTASASEIVAGSLQDLDRAVVIGTRSFGKGLVQTTRPVAHGGMLKVTVARYYIPSGRLIQAVDYSHRNPDGSVAPIPDSLRHTWYTAGGRPVLDGGGITPDIVAEDTTANRLLYNVMRDNWAFDFANRYRATHDTLQAGWQVDDATFDEFKAFIDPERFNYDRMSEEGVKYMRQAARVEGYLNDSVSTLLDRLEQLMRHDLNHDLDFNRPHLERIIDSEISDRYFGDDIIAARSLRYDLVVDTARAVVLDRERYDRLLAPVAR